MHWKMNKGSAGGFDRFLKVKNGHLFSIGGKVDLSWHIDNLFWHWLENETDYAEAIRVVSRWME